MMDYQIQVDDKSSFITLIIEGLNLQHMIIPPEFVEYLDKEYFSRHLILTSPSGNQWQVTVLKKEDDIYMQNGWPKFLRDNMVEPHQLLLFTYDGENRFHVQIFGINGCEKLNTKKAGQIEAASTSQITTAASFYQIFSPKFCSERLPIPNDFVKLARFEETVPKEFILRNVNGSMGWFVEARRIGSGIYFCDGWKQFVSDNCLEENDFIIFKYDGENIMKLKVLKLYGWEKLGVEDEGMNATENDYMPDNREEEFTEEEEECEMEEQDHRAGKAPLVGKNMFSFFML
ncbi:hypothetical protein RIF29_32211 [Crotalaria pallida]|uniref:TF-B3 domain-containing protein n=1 Tax=Crotalaria pallida TaxID=3830 RepID=A0AAN9EQ33_CROPI